MFLGRKLNRSQAGQILGGFSTRRHHAHPDLANVGVGSCVSVYWPDDDEYCDTTVAFERKTMNPCI
jgi:hypothetical protein